MHVDQFAAVSEQENGIADLSNVNAGAWFEIGDGVRCPKLTASFGFKVDKFASQPSEYRYAPPRCAVEVTLNTRRVGFGSSGQRSVASGFPEASRNKMPPTNRRSVAATGDDTTLSAGIAIGVRQYNAPDAGLRLAMDSGVRTIDCRALPAMTTIGEL